jgi:hypothetical protein
LPNLPILEALAPDPNQEAKIERYARWMKANPLTVLGHKIESQPRFAEELKEAWKRRDEQAKKFSQGKDPSEWNLFDQRTKVGLRDSLLGRKK